MSLTVRGTRGDLHDFVRTLDLLATWNLSAASDAPTVHIQQPVLAAAENFHSNFTIARLCNNHLACDCLGSQHNARVQFYDDETTVADIKNELERLEGIPFEQLVLIHGGEELLNDINLRRHGLTDFNQSNEVFIDLQVVMRDPKHIYLMPACRAGSLICERVERCSLVADVLPLLEQHGLTAAIPRDCSVIVKRHDGGTIGALRLRLRDTIEMVEEKIGAALGVPEPQLVFVPSADGNLHMVGSPDRKTHADTHTLYNRSVAVQPPMQDQSTHIGPAKLAEKRIWASAWHMLDVTRGCSSAYV